VFAIDKGDYILFPGGGIDDGEQPRDAAIRETLEESNRHVVNVTNAGVVESVWPEDSGNDFWDSSEFDGERTYFFIGLDTGDAGISHADAEKFKLISFDDLKSKLKKLIEDESQAWAKRNNEERLKLVEQAEDLASKSVTPIKQAAATPVMSETGNVPAQGAPSASDDPNKRFVDGLINKLMGSKGGAQPPASPPADQGGAGQPAPELPPPPPGKEEPANPMGDVQLPPKIAEELIGGRADGKHGSEYDPVEFVEGAKIEMEHTNKGSESIEIAKDHLEEIPDYYTRLKKMEDKADEEGMLKKEADVVKLVPREDHILFLPDGRIVIQKSGKRRFRFPTAGPGRKAPYETPLPFIPESGIPQEGYHGFVISPRVGEVPDVPEGFEAASPDEVLRDLYASMGLSANKPYRHLDRMRARIINRWLKSRKPAVDSRSQPAVSLPEGL
jgi:ADP-ribose pyrophosphatase YjhB (NUDIX family)